MRDLSQKVLSSGNVVFDGSQEHQSGEFKGKRYSVIFHQVTVSSLTDGVKRSLNSLRFPVVAPQSKNKVLVLVCGTKPHILDEGLNGDGKKRPFAFSEVVSEERDLLQATQDGLMDPELQVTLLSQVHLDLRAVLDIFKSHGQAHGASHSK